MQSGNLDDYMERLVRAFNPAAAAGVMCRNTLSVGWDGTLYDCDFNQMLELPVALGPPRTILRLRRRTPRGAPIVHRDRTASAAPPAPAPAAAAPPRCHEPLDLAFVAATTRLGWWGSDVQAGCRDSVPGELGGRPRRRPPSSASPPAPV